MQMQSPAAVNLKFFQKHPNAGDQFSRAIAQHYFSTRLVCCDDRPLAQPNLLPLGSILEWADMNSHVCGTGLISSASRLRSAPRSINCVRGPLTALFLEKQGIKATNAFGDPGILAPSIFALNPLETVDIGVIPHYKDAASPWLERCRKSGIEVINVFWPLVEYFEALQRCKIILSSSLHGLIFAHAYGKPALWIELSDRITGNGFKFFDYYLSIGVSPESVVRLRVSGDTDPHAICSLATTGNHSDLRSSLEAAIYKTRRELNL